jgi:phosphomannomutase
MMAMNTPLGGDGSGSIGYGDVLRGYDSLLSMGKILEAMATTGETITERIERLPCYHIIKRTIKTPSGDVSKILNNLKKWYLKQDLSVRLSEKDGIRFDWDTGWIHLRASATEPVIRMILEWKNQDVAEEKALEIQTLLEGGVWS